MANWEIISTSEEEDLYHCKNEQNLKTDVENDIVNLVVKAGLTVVDTSFHFFGEHGDSGYTAVVVLAESALCIHTWPEKGAVHIALNYCNYTQDNSGKAAALMKSLREFYDCVSYKQHEPRFHYLEPKGK